MFEIGTNLLEFLHEGILVAWLYILCNFLVNVRQQRLVAKRV